MTTGERHARGGSGRTTWADVERRAAGEPVDELVARRSRRRRLNLVFAGGAVAAIGGFALGWLFARDGVGEGIVSGTADRADPSTFVTIAYLVLLLLGAVVWVVGGIVVFRKQGFTLAWKEPTVGLPRRERRSIERELRGRTEPDATHVPTLRRLAALRLRQSLVTMVLLGGWVPGSLGQSLNPTFPWSTWLWLGFAGLSVAGFVWTYRVRSQWRAFLAAHPDDATTDQP